MSQENVELTRRAYAAIGRHDLDGLLALTDPDVVAVPRILAVEGGTLRGHDGIREWWEGVFSAFPDFSLEVLEIRDVGDLTLSRSAVLYGHGQESGVPF